MLFHINWKTVTIPPVFRQFISIMCCKFPQRSRIIWCCLNFKVQLSFVSGDLLMFSAASTFAWPSINSNELQQKNSTYATGALSFNEISYVISIANAGSIVGNLINISNQAERESINVKIHMILLDFAGNFAVVPVAAIIGPKLTIHLCAIPIITSALLIIWSQNVYFLYVSRLLIGFVGGGLPVTVPLLINDICFDK